MSFIKWLMLLIGYTLSLVALLAIAGLIILEVAYTPHSFGEKVVSLMIYALLGVVVEDWLRDIHTKLESYK